MGFIFTCMTRIEFSNDQFSMSYLCGSAGEAMLLKANDQWQANVNEYKMKYKVQGTIQEDQKWFLNIYR